jgi:hypothetical protein
MGEFEKPRRPGRPSPPPVAGRASLTEKLKAAAPPVNPAALSEKMAAISSLRESTTQKPGKKPAWHERGLAQSSLPEALSRVDRRLRMEGVPQRISDAQKALEKARSSDEVQMEDPDPGPVTALIWFMLRFGRFVQGPMLRQTPLMLIGLLILLSMTFCVHLMEWTHPSLTTITSLYTSPAFFLRLGASFVFAMCFYLGISFLLIRWIRSGETGISTLFGLRIVVNAFLPLGVVQIIYVLLHHLLLGEAFWRGATLGVSSAWSLWVFPLAWLWCGFRLAQAVSALVVMSVSRRVLVKSMFLVAAALFSGLLHPAVVEWVHQEAVEEWDVQRKQVLQPGAQLNEAAFAEIERKLPLHAVQARQELYLFRLQQYFRQGDLDAAEEDAIRLERISPENSAMDHLAKGLHLFLRGRLDLAVKRWNAAVEVDPDCLHAHQWLALAAVGDNAQEAESHARILMHLDPNVFHLYLYVRILDMQDKHAAIWEAMLDVDAPPEEWYPLTLLQGGLAAQELGRTRRAERLLTLAQARGLSPPLEPENPSAAPPESAED